MNEEMEVIELHEDSRSPQSSHHSFNEVDISDAKNDIKSSFFTCSKETLDFKPYICPYCEFPFKWLANLKEHVKAYHKRNKVFCRYCCKEFENPSELRKHVQEHISSSNECPYCKLPLGTISLDLHYPYCNGKRPKSPHLQMPSNTKAHFMLHGKYKVQVSNDDVSFLYWEPSSKDENNARIVDWACIDCSTKFSSEQALANHKCKSEPIPNHNPLKIPSTNMTPLESTSVGPAIAKPKTTPTHSIKPIFSASNKYSSPHLLCSFINSQTPDSGEECSQCPLCYTDVFQNTIIAHLIEKHEMSFENVICVYTALNKRFTRVVLCKWCKREFKKSSSCTAHSRCCYRRPTYLNNACSKCQSTFTTYDDFLSHHCVKEYKFENAQCQACNILLNNLLTFDFKNHEKICTSRESVVSNQPQPTTPSATPQPTPSIPTLVSPQPYTPRRGRRPKEFSCPKCKEVFALKTLLTNHCLTCFQPHQQEDKSTVVSEYSSSPLNDVSEMKFCCTVCGQCFQTESLLASHPCDPGVLDVDVNSLVGGTSIPEEPIIPLVEPPEINPYRRSSRGRPRGRPPLSYQSRGRTVTRGRSSRGRRRRTRYSDSDSDPDFALDDDPPYKRNKTQASYNRSFYDNGHSRNNNFVPSSSPYSSTLPLKDLVNRTIDNTKVSKGCLSCDAILPQNSLVCSDCGTDNAVFSSDVGKKSDDDDDEVAPIVIDLDKLSEDVKPNITANNEVILPSEENDSGVKCHYEDFNYQTINTFHGFIPLNQSHYICSKCFNNVSSLSLLAEHLVAKHDIKLPESLKIGKMKGAFVSTAISSETII